MSQKFPDKLAHQARSMHKGGLTVAQISKRLSAPYATVRYWVYTDQVRALHKKYKLKKENDSRKKSQAIILGTIAIFVIIVIATFYISK